VGGSTVCGSSFLSLAEAAVHELSICGAIAGIVRERAGDRQVETVHLQVGQLRQIVPDTLIYCWSLVTADTALGGSRIAVESIAAKIVCRSCTATMEIGDLPIFVCQKCQGADVEVIAGEEFLITSLDLAEA
jgi:hydrogenase nickel incorporation protein HypA/HybF